MTRWDFSVGPIPDPAEHRLVAVAGGNVAGHVFERAEHLLRMVGRFPPGTLGFGLRALFDPDAGTLQDRLRWFLTVYSDEVSPATVATLVHDGPLGPFYRLEPIEPDVATPPVAYSNCTEVVREEEALTPLVPVELNARVPTFYYTVHPFRADRGNDYLLLDRALSEVAEPVRFDLLVSPSDSRPLRDLHFEALSRLLAVNAYDDSTFIPGESQTLGRGESFFSDDHLPSSGASPSQRVKDPLADEFLRSAQDLLENLRRPQLQFSVKVFAGSRETARAVAAVVAESCFQEGRYHLLSYDDALPWMAESLAASNAGRHLGEPCDLAPFGGLEPPEKLRALRGLARIATAEELVGAFRLPVGGRSSPRCMRRSTDPRPVGDGVRSILVGHDLEMGLDPESKVTTDLSTILDGPAGRVPHLGLPLDLLNKHLFVAGAPGSGKTTAVFNLLVQLHRHGIPFLVIEPAKTEYRVLKALADHPDPTVSDLARRLRVYTPGNENLSPLRFNPLEYPDEEISRDEHIANLMACFKASFPMWGPLPAIIADAVEESYRSLPAERRWPTVADVVTHARDIAAGKGYEGEVASNIEASINVRLENLTRRSVGRIFGQEHSTPGIDELLGEPGVPTIIELEHVDPETGCLLTLFLLSAMRQRIRMRPTGSGLSHVIVIEEAHNIVGRTGDGRGGEDSVDPRAFAAQYVSRMLAELRALGEGLVVADQLPSTVAPEVIKNTGTKLAGRLVSRDDREDLGATMLLGPVETEEIARLRVGEAYLYHERLHGPRRVRGLNSAAYLGLANAMQPTGRRILDHVAGDAWFQGVLKLQVEEVTARLVALTGFLDTCADRLEVVVDRLSEIAAEDGLADYLQEKLDIIEVELQRQYELFYFEVLQPVWQRVDEVGAEALKEVMRGVDAQVADAVNPVVEGLMERAVELHDEIRREAGRQ